MNDTKEHIMKVSLGLFMQKSFKEVTMKDIVENTGLSKGAFYHYFESKEQLFLEVVNKGVNDFLVDYNKINKDSLYEFYHGLIDYANSVYDLFAKNRENKEIGFDLNYFSLMFDAIRLFPSFREGLFETLDVELNAWKEVIKVSREKGEINSKMSDEHIAKMFIYSNDAAGLHNIMKGGGQVIPDSLLELWDSFYEQLKG